MANNFNADDDIRAVWRMESGVLTTDSKGSNTLSDNGTVGESTGDYKEGGCSADYDGSSDYHNITDGNLDSGFPLKSGESNKDFSVCFWCNPDTKSGATYTCVSKYNTSGNLRCFWFGHYNGQPRFQLGYNSGISWELKDFDTLFTCDGAHWYHCGFTYDNSDKSFRIRIWDDTASGFLDSDKTGTFTLDANKISITTADVELGSQSGGGSRFNGHLDEVVIASKVLTTTEIDQIRQQTFGPSFHKAIGTVHIGTPHIGGSLVL